MAETRYEIASAFALFFGQDGVERLANAWCGAATPLREHRPLTRLWPYHVGEHLFLFAAAVCVNDIFALL